MNCQACGHDDHGTGPCFACTQSQTGTCWQRIQVVGGDGDRTATGLIEMATGKETKPCCMCRKWENVGSKRVVEYCLSQGLEVQPDGKFKTPIAKDIPGRVSLTIDPRSYGFCKRDQILTDTMATCDGWTPTKRITELQDRMTRR